MDELAPGTRVSDYRIEHELGRGGMSVVYAATHLVIGKRVALKVVRSLLCADATGRVRAILEARAVNQIAHPNIVDVYGYGQLDDGRCYLVMERLDGETLQQRMERRPLGIDECRAILLPLCDALEAAHERGVVHRDVKPANVHLMPLRSGADHVKLIDFGLAKLLDGESNVTLSGVVLGTPDYIAPEQARGGAVDARSDVYALGVMAFEMLAQRLPFSGNSTRELLRRHIEEAPPRLRELSPSSPRALEALLVAMLAKDPSARPSLGEVRRVLVELRARPARPHRWRLAGALAALLLVGGGVAAAGAWMRHIAAPSSPHVIARRALLPPSPTVRPHSRSATGDELLDLFTP
jgi:serine/threonine-protein kinase